MLTARFIAMPAIALAVIAGLAHAHSGAGMSQTETRTVYRAVNCSMQAPSVDATCAIAGNAPASMVR
ncbi:MAG TPA: hypothetical protein VFB68_18065 [Xanthobacteraceae bacterium]|nr:hypothetical protein [Xanthobacteraceae bacterium]